MRNPYVTGGVKQVLLAGLLVAAPIAFVAAIARPDYLLGLRDAVFSVPRETSAPDTGTDVSFVRDVTVTRLDPSTIDFSLSTTTAITEEMLVQQDEPVAGADSKNRNRLIVPKMGVDAEVIVEDTQKALNKGLWHIPGSAFPGSNGNIVIAAHRWLYKPPNPKTFYSIDTMEVGDEIYYEFENSRYVYSVNKIEIVDPDDVHILSQNENKLTLFTCHPLYSTSKRIVVSAELISVSVL